MIIKGKSYITNSLFPNIDWIGDADYVLDDNSILAQRILELSPNYKFVIENKVLVDVLPLLETEEGYIDMSKYK